MKPVLSHTSALEYWRSTRVEPRSYHVVSRAKNLLTTPPRTKLLVEPGPWWLSRPLHVLVGNDCTRRLSSNIISHVWSKKLPKGSVLDTGNGFYVCSPELCFVQLACSLSLIQLIELGFELCGTYDVSSDDIRSCASLTSTEKLTSFVSAMESVRGKKKATRALRFVTDNSASPMETSLTMLLCLPYSLGGYGLPLPQLNYRIDTIKRVKASAQASYYVCDLFWQNSNLAAEYDSDDFHTGVSRISQDSIRRDALATMGIFVVTVTRWQINDGGAMNLVAHLIASKVGKRLVYKDPDFTRKSLDLRRALLGKRNNPIKKTIDPTT